MFNRYKHIIGFCLLAALLAIPYGIKLVTRGALEAYPALILPSGAHIIKKSSDSFQFISTGIYGQDQNSGEWRYLDPASFFAPIPVYYFYAIYKNEFGLNPDLEYPVKFRRKLLPDFAYNNRASVTEQEIGDTKSWLRTRLAKHGCKEEMLLVRQVRKSANMKTRKVTEIGIDYEKTYELF